VGETMNFKTNNLVLLTGAGFTKNFGGYLAHEIWSKIFNYPSVKNRSRVKNVLQDNFDFEAIYFEVMSDDKFDAEDKSAITEAIENAYHDLDQTVRDWNFRPDNPTAFNTYKLADFLSLFVGNGHEKGLFFTLNQDLLMERKNNHRPPGVAPFPNNFYHLGTDLEGKDFVRLPKEEEMDAAKKTIDGYAGLVYIKLHGSYGWLSSSGETRMVIGKNKLEDIQQEPILQWYFELFHNTLLEGSKKLLIIGYGFKDEHINQILLQAIQEAGLKLFIISPTDPEKFKSNIEKNINGSKLWNAIEGYFPYTFQTIFPPDQRATPELEEIKKGIIS